MCRINGFQKMLSVMLALLMAVSLFSVAASAESPKFRPLPNYSAGCESGEYWIADGLLAEATGVSVYNGAIFSISEDNTIIQIGYSLNGTWTTETHSIDTEPVFFEYLRLVPAFNLLPTSPDGLEDGAYWFDKAGIVDAYEKYYGETYYFLYTYQGDYYLSVDGTMLRRAYVKPGTEEIGYTDSFAANEPLEFNFLRQVGIDPNAGFSLLPTSEEGLQTGDYWFDVDSLVPDMQDTQFSSDNLKLYLNAYYYISNDRQTLRVITMGRTNDYSKANNHFLFNYLMQVGVDPYAGFTRLPTSEEGLEDGAAWFDAAAYAQAQNNDLYLKGQYYLSGDGKTVRVKAGIYRFNITLSSSYAFYLRQAGVDPMAGFALLPTSEEGLPDGAYWYDAAGLAASRWDVYLNGTYYLSENGQTLRIFLSSGALEDYSIDDFNAGLYFGFLHQKGVDPMAGFLPVVQDIREIECYGYLLLVDEAIDGYIDLLNTEAAADGDPPMDAEEEAETREMLQEEFAELKFFYRLQDDLLGMDEDGSFSTFGQGSDIYEIIAPYIELAENHAWDDGVVTVEPTAETAGEKFFSCTRCDATKTEAAKDVFWAGYEHQFDTVTLDKGVKPDVAPHNLFVITRKNTLKVQLRFASGSTLTFSRDGVGGGRTATCISDVVYDGVACELWVVDYALNSGTYTAVAKLKYVKPIGDITDVYGCSFTVDTPTYGTVVYSAEINTVNPEYGFIVFNGSTKQVITVVTGTDVQKVQLRNDATGSTLTYNASNAKIVENTLDDGTPVLVWTIERLFARGNYVFSIYTRSLLGLNDSGKDLSFKVDAPSSDVILISVDVEVDAKNNKDVFTVMTQNGVSKVKFTDVASGATITANKTGTDKIKVDIAQNEDGKTMTWTITVNHHSGHTYDCQAMLGGTYTDAKRVSVPKDDKQTLLYSVTNEVNEAQTYVTFTVVTHKDAAKVKLTNKTTGGTITALPGGAEKVAVTISEPNEAGQKTWTITVKYLTKDADVTYTCQAFIGETFQSDVIETVVKAPVEA